ncbi:ZIP family metal transporter [Alkalihalobacillus sp. CinArs1]|uniref:ZIP family metal transporter n=1 Tax=Alkalihalobacillus sp. CinArs1 TaxID=2995314 RepID=UPI0022DE8035|nr:ZIP family metal transporter [Alkalihalobacillus sp. CinArs1]
MFSLLTNLFLVGISGLLVGAAVGRGAYRHYSHRMEELYLLCGGMLIGVIVFELIPESMHSFEPMGILLGALLSFLLFVLIEASFHNRLVHNKYVPVIAFVFALLSHSIPVGVAIGINGDGGEFGGVLLLALFIHHIPEGVALVLFMAISGLKSRYSILAAALISFALVLSAALGTHVAPSYTVNGFLTGVAIGSLSYVAWYEIILKVKGRVFLRTLFLYISMGILIIVTYMKIVHKLF